MESYPKGKGTLRGIGISTLALGTLNYRSKNQKSLKSFQQNQEIIMLAQINDPKAISRYNSVSIIQIRAMVKNSAVNELLRKYEAGERDFAGIDLSFTDLSHLNLKGVNFSRAILEGVNLSRTNLKFADFSGAHLEGADLTGADLFNAKLRRAKLNDAQLVEAFLDSADLTDANLLGANLSDADLLRAKMPDGGLLSSANSAELSQYTTHSTLNCNKSVPRLNLFKLFRPFF